MKVMAPESAINALKEIIAENQDKPNNVRVYFAGFSCSGASFALALDEKSDDDVSCDLEGVNFIMNQDEFLSYGNVTIQEIPNRGFMVVVDNMPSNDGGCSGCSGGCGH